MNRQDDNPYQSVVADERPERVSSGRIKFIGIVMLILGGIGVLGLAGAILGSLFQSMVPMPVSTGSDGEMLRRVAAMQKDLMKWGLGFAIVNSLVGGGLIATAVLLLRHNNRAVALSNIVLPLACILEVARMIFSYIAVSRTSEFFEGIDVPQKGLLEMILTASNFGGLFCAGIFSLLKIGFFLISLKSTRSFFMTAAEDQNNPQ